MSHPKRPRARNQLAASLVAEATREDAPAPEPAIRHPHAVARGTLGAAKAMPCSPFTLCGRGDGLGAVLWDARLDGHQMLPCSCMEDAGKHAAGAEAFGSRPRARATRGATRGETLSGPREGHIWGQLEDRDGLSIGAETSISTDSAIISRR